MCRLWLDGRLWSMTVTNEWVHGSCSLSASRARTPLRVDAARDDALCPLVTADCLQMLEQAVNAPKKMKHAWCNGALGLHQACSCCCSLQSWFDGSAHQQCEALGSNLQRTPQICLRLREVWLAVNVPFWKRAPGSGLVTSYRSGERRVEPALFLGRTSY